MAKISKEINAFIKHVYSEYDRSELPEDDIMDIILIEFYLTINNDKELNIFYPKISTMLPVFMHFNENFKSGEIMRVYNERIKV